MNIQNFQTFFSIFLRLNVFTKYIEIVKLKKLYEKLSFQIEERVNCIFSRIRHSNRNTKKIHAYIQ